MISESYQQCISESEDRTNDYKNISENYYFNIIELNGFTTKLILIGDISEVHQFQHIGPGLKTKSTA